MHKLNQVPEVRNILNNFNLKKSKNFTKLLEIFRKKYGNWGPSDNKEDTNSDWVEIYERTIKEYTNYHLEENDLARTNILRFTRLLAINKIIFIEYHEELINLYLSTITDKNGNIRNAGYRLLENMRFSLTFHSEPREDNDNPQKHKNLRKAWVNLFIDLVNQEIIYVKKKKKELSSCDYNNKYRTYSIDTRNTYLKTLRRGIEMIDRGMYFDKLLDEFGFLEKVRTKSEIAEYLNFKSIKYST